jgi:hypothetical protein
MERARSQEYINTLLDLGINTKTYTLTFLSYTTVFLLLFSVLVYIKPAKLFAVRNDVIPVIYFTSILQGSLFDT